MTWRTIDLKTIATYFPGRRSSNSAEFPDFFLYLIFSPIIAVVVVVGASVTAIVSVGIQVAAAVISAGSIRTLRKLVFNH